MDVTVKVTKEAYEVGVALVELTKLAKASSSLADFASKVPGVLPVLFAAVQGVDLLDDEYKADKAAMLKGLSLAVGDIAGILLP